MLLAVCPVFAAVACQIRVPTASMDVAFRQTCSNSRLLLFPVVVRFEEPWADEAMIARHPENDVRTFLEDSAVALGLVLDREAKTRALLELRSIRLADDAEQNSAGGDNVRSVSGAGDMKRIVKGERDRVIACAEDVYAAVVETLSKALVHCQRFEVRSVRKSKWRSLSFKGFIAI